jgi:hypothetical protein
MASPVSAFAGQHAQLTPPIEVKCAVTTDLGCTAPSTGNNAVVRFTPFKKAPAALKVTLTFGPSDTFDSGEEIAIAAPDGNYIGVVNTGASRTSATFTIDSGRSAMLAAALSSRQLDVFAAHGSMYVSAATVTGLY